MQSPPLLFNARRCERSCGEIRPRSLITVTCFSLRPLKGTSRADGLLLMGVEHGVMALNSHAFKLGSLIWAGDGEAVGRFITAELWRMLKTSRPGRNRPGTGLWILQEKLTPAALQIHIY